MLNLRRSVVGAALVLLVSGVASAQTPSPTDIAALRVKANAGNADAQYNLGVWYRFGQGVPQDSAQGAAWIRKSSEQGHIGAQFNLGLIYFNGQGVPQDYAQAASWYLKSSEQGNPGAQFNLGLMYSNGQGVPQDYVEAHKWRNLAASRASAENQTRYAETRDAVATLMTPAQLAEAQTLAREWQAAFDARQE
jgi:hypothetical protein